MLYVMLFALKGLDLDKESPWRSNICSLISTDARMYSRGVCLQSLMTSLSLANFFPLRC